MNLEALKSIWQEMNVQEAPAESLAIDELREMLAARSRDTLRSLRRMILWESGLILLMGGLILAWLLAGGIAFSTTELTVVALFLGISARFYWVKYRALHPPALRDADLKTTLTHITEALDRYLRFYRFVSIACVPLFAGGGVVYGLLKQGQAEGFDPAGVSFAGWAFVALSTLLFSGLMVLFSRWYTRRYYGRRLDALRACLAELDA